MLALNSSTRYLLYHRATDMRKGFSGLSGLVNNELNTPVMNGDVFIFLNKRRNQIKLLQWDRDGFAIYHKRLEAGTFELPASATQDIQGVITSGQLALILQGISLKQVFYRKRYLPKKVA